ncbi:MAG TPA: universal stress protein [Flavisolibacter sp.]|nr:universal stress protein [Flavisolibacter sp.]
MKKIIAAFDGLNFSDSAKDYALFTAKQMGAHLVGVFLEDFTVHSYSMAELTKYEGSFDEHLDQLNQKDKETRNEAVTVFEKACRQAGISYSVRRNKNIALQDLLYESIYSDLLIIDTKETFTRFEEIPPTRYMRDLLSDVQCPVLVVPSEYKPIENIVFLYDGEPSSVHAVKMFSYLMPFFKDYDMEFVTARQEDESLDLPEDKLMKEFIKQHYPKANYAVLKGFIEDRIVSYLAAQKKNTLVVVGAYRRTRMSRLFRASMADVLMNHLQLPLFIAHNK